MSVPKEAQGEKKFEAIIQSRRFTAEFLHSLKNNISWFQVVSDGHRKNNYESTKPKRKRSSSYNQSTS